MSNFSHFSLGHFSLLVSIRRLLSYRGSNYLGTGSQLLLYREVNWFCRAANRNPGKEWEARVCWGYISKNDPEMSKGYGKKDAGIENLATSRGLLEFLRWAFNPCTGKVNLLPESEIFWFTSTILPEGVLDSRRCRKPPTEEMKVHP